MAGINFNSNSFQLRATSLKKANVAPEAQKKEEEVKAGSEEKKPVIKTKIQNSSLNLLGNYNMVVSLNTIAKKATLSAGGKAGVVNNDQGDKKVENDVEKYWAKSEFLKKMKEGVLNPGDFTYYQTKSGKYIAIVIQNDGKPKASIAYSESEAIDNAGRDCAR